MKHLTRRRLNSILRGDKAARKEVRDHLARGCPECEAFLASEEAAELGAHADSLLFLSGPGVPDGDDDKGFDSMLRRLSRSTRRARIASAATVVLMTATAAVVSYIARPVQPSEFAEPGLKSGTPPSGSQLELRLLEQTADGRLIRVAPGGYVEPDSALLIRYRTNLSSPAKIFLVDASDGSLAQVAAFELEEGEHDVRSPGGYLAVPMRPSVKGVLLAACPKDLPPRVLFESDVVRECTAATMRIETGLHATLTDQ